MAKRKNKDTDTEQQIAETVNSYIMDLDSLTKINVPIIGSMLVLKNSDTEEIGIAVKNMGLVELTHYFNDETHRVTFTFKVLKQLIKKLSKS